MADYRSLEIKVAHARHLKNVNLLSAMDSYVTVSLSWDPQTRHKTPVDRTGNKNPTWNFPITFMVDVAASRLARPTLTFDILCERALGDKLVGKVHVPLTELLDSVDHARARHVAYQVKRPSGRGKGELSFSYQWGERLVEAPSLPSAPPLLEGGKVDEVVTTSALVGGVVPGYSVYPSGPHGEYQYQYQHHPVVGQHVGFQYQYPPVVAHQSPSYVGHPPSYQYGGYLTPPHHYGGYQTPAGPSYGYQAQPGYGYPQVPAAPKRSSRVELGLGAGVLGGLLAGGLLF